jgi:hypothetical protein
MRPPTYEAPIYLRSLESRFGNEQGAREGWEAMIAWLVRLDHPAAERIEARRGDGGIDVMVGDLGGGDIAIWQAKYFSSIRKSQKAQINKSFESALTSAAQRGNRIVRWVLCVPINLDIPARQWWEGWRAGNERQHHVRIDLWGETELVRLIARRKAADLRAYFFGASRPDAELVGPPAASAASLVSELADPTWAGGSLIRLGSDTYLLHEGSAERISADHAVVCREGTADRVGHRAERVYLRQVRVVSQTPAAAEQRAGLRGQARALADLAGRGGLPRLLTTYDHGDSVTVVTAQPDGPTWREVFGPGAGPLDRISAARACAAAVSLCAALAELHRVGHSHRAMSPESIILADRARRALLRDPGLLALPPNVGEGPDAYRAPEQSLAYDLRETVGPRTDIYQLGALLYHTMTSHPPSGTNSPSLQATNPDIPHGLDELLRQCLHRDPRQRPAGLRPVMAVLADGRRRLSGGERT